MASSKKLITSMICLILSALLFVVSTLAWLSSSSIVDSSVSISIGDLRSSGTLYYHQNNDDIALRNVDESISIDDAKWNAVSDTSLLFEMASPGDVFYFKIHLKNESRSVSGKLDVLFGSITQQLNVNEYNQSYVFTDKENHINPDLSNKLGDYNVTDYGIGLAMNLDVRNVKYKMDTASDSNTNINMGKFSKLEEGQLTPNNTTIYAKEAILPQEEVDIIFTVTFDESILYAEQYISISNGSDNFYFRQGGLVGSGEPNSNVFQRQIFTFKNIFISLEQV